MPKRVRLKDTEGNPISSGGLCICTPCQPVSGNCDCRPYIVAMELTSDPFPRGGLTNNFSLGVPYVFNPGYLGTAGWFDTPEGLPDPQDGRSSYSIFHICGQGIIGGKRICYDFFATVAAVCKADGNIALYLARPRSSAGFSSADLIVIGFAYPCNDPANATLLTTLTTCPDSSWKGPYSFSYTIPFVDPLTSTTHNLTFAGKIYANPDMTQISALPGAVDVTHTEESGSFCNAGTQPVAEIGCIACEDYVPILNCDRVYQWYGPCCEAWRPGNLYTCDPFGDPTPDPICCDGLGNCGDAFCQTPPNPGTCCGGQSSWPTVPMTASGGDICATCVLVPTDFRWLEHIGPNGEPGYFGILGIHSCGSGQPGGVIVMLMLCRADGTWEARAFSIEFGSFVREDIGPISTFPCTPGFNNLYFTFGLIMNPGSGTWPCTNSIGVQGGTP